MIPLNELRIGNLIYDYDEHTFYPIEEIKLNAQGNMCVIYRNGSFMSTEFIPTKLTEELLLKFGFKKINETNVDDDDFDWVYRLEIKTNNTEISFGKYKNELQTFLWSGDCLYHIKYIHQLQNLYFALTGEELKNSQL